MNSIRELQRLFNCFMRAIAQDALIIAIDLIVFLSIENSSLLLRCMASSLYLLIIGCS